MTEITNTKWWKEKGGEYANDLDGRMLANNSIYLKQVDFIYENIKKFKFNSILEVGSNNGRVIGKISKRLRNRDFNACDISPDALKILEKRYPRVKTKVVDITKGLPYKDNEFDVVFTSEVLCHIAHYDIDKVREELKRVANKYLILCEPWKKELEHLDKHLYNIGDDSHGGTWVHQHIKYFDVEDTIYDEETRTKIFIIKL